MSKESSFDIVSEFDMQEMRNAVDQCKKEILNRYDFKGENTEIELGENKINLVASSEYKLQAIHSSLFQKAINRGISTKVFDIKKSEPTSGAYVKQEINLIEAMDSENAKKINKLIRDNFPKVKSRIEGPSIRVLSAKKDDLQAVITFLKGLEDLEIALQFTNYR